jgi:SAM-dependent methyltransferase
VLDLAAGTGKLTASLGAYDVVAVEPDPEMLARLRADLPHIDARHGAAEDIPLPDASVDAVLVGQAVHWFDMERALPEIARVLRPGGVLAGLWNGEDDTVEWVAGFHRAGEIMRRTPGVSSVDPFDPPRSVTGLFAKSEHACFPNPVPTTIDGLIATISTHSWVLVSEPAERDATLGRMRDYLAARPETSAGEFVLPLVTDVLRALRR